MKTTSECIKKLKEELAFFKEDHNTENYNVGIYESTGHANIMLLDFINLYIKPYVDALEKDDAKEEEIVDKDACLRLLFLSIVSHYLSEYMYSGEKVDDENESMKKTLKKIDDDLEETGRCLLK